MGQTQALKLFAAHARQLKPLGLAKLRWEGAEGHRVRHPVLWLHQKFLKKAACVCLLRYLIP
mgnify:CR=1 FL=1